MIPIIPESDGRYRVHTSTLLWVCEVERDENDNCATVEILKGCERTIYRLEGKEGDYVQYNNNWYILNSADMFENMVIQAKKEEIYLFSNELVVSPAFPETFKQLAIQPYIELLKT